MVDELLIVDGGASVNDYKSKSSLQMNIMKKLAAQNSVSLCWIYPMPIIGNKQLQKVFVLIMVFAYALVSVIFMIVSCSVVNCPLFPGI